MIPEELKRPDAEKVERKKQIQQMMKYSQLLGMCWEVLLTEKNMDLTWSLKNLVSSITMEMTNIALTQNLEERGKWGEYRCTCKEECLKGIDKQYACEYWEACRNCIYLEEKENQTTDETPKGGADHD